MGLQVTEVLIGFQVRVLLGNRHQTGEGRGKFALHIIEFLDSLLVQLIKVYPHLRGFCTGLHNLGQRVLFMLRVAFHRVHEVRDQVQTTLVLIFHVRPLGGYILTPGYHLIVTSFKPHEDSNHDDDNYSYYNITLFHVLLLF